MTNSWTKPRRPKSANPRLAAALAREATRSLIIYVIGESELGPCKIGYTDRVQARLREMQTGNPRELTIYFQWLTDKPRLVERIAHSLIAPRYRIRGEWFNVTPDDAELTIRRAAELADRAQGVEPEAEIKTNT